MLMAGTYPSQPLSAVPAVMLEAFKARVAIEVDSDELAEKLDEAEVQRIYALDDGATRRAMTCGLMCSHDTQAAAILAGLQELGILLEGGMTVGGVEGLREKLDHDEFSVLEDVRRLLTKLLRWHFDNGAGELLPIAKHMGLAHEMAVTR